jgi:predicted regulator of Ras-like GTPase activity (Roadblock/LC7/MglB family)
VGVGPGPTRGLVDAFAHGTGHVAKGKPPWLREKFTQVGKPASLRPMFKEALRSVVEGTEGSIAGLLMDFEGIPVESFTRDGSNFDIETVGAEVSVVVKAIQRAGEMLDVGDTQEVALKSEKMTTLIRIINQTYFVAITMDPEGNLGKGRFLLRVLAPKLAQELAT